MSDTRILITGASGFIGKYVCKELERKGVDFIGLIHNKKDKGNYINCSILDRERLRKIVKDYQPTAVLHLAAIASPAHSDIPRIYEINVVGSENLLDAIRQESAVGKTRVVMVSSAGVYGNQERELLDENTSPAPVNHYSYSKMIMEMLLSRYVNDFETCIVRPFNIIGVGQQENFLIPKLVKAFVQKEEVLRLGNINTSRDYLNVEYAANGFVKLLTDKIINDRVLNFCTGRATTCMSVIDLLAEIAKHKPKIEISDEFVRTNELYRLVGDPDKFNNFMGSMSKPKMLNEILEDMVNYYKVI